MASQNVAFFTPPSPREHRRGGYGSRSGQTAAEPSKIIRAHQRGLDVIAERGGHVGGGGGDPAEPGDRGDGQQHAGDLLFVRALRQRPVVLHSRQTPGAPIAASAPTRASAAVLGSSREAGRPSPSPAWSSTQPSSMIASLRKISWNRTLWFIRLTPQPSTSPPRAGPAVIA